MAKFNRTAKPVALWSKYDLDAFNIEITNERDIQTFFGVSDLPVPQNISPIIWNDAKAPAGTLPKTEKTFFAYIKDALVTPPEQKSFVDDLSLFLLELFDYDAGRNRVLQSQENLWLSICGSQVPAKSDGAVLERVGPHSYYILLVQEDTHRYDCEADEPEAQLVAQAIAAFQQNNRTRYRIGLPALDSQTFPAIIMFHTAPAFYYVTITTALSGAVQAGFYPQETTFVRRFISAVPLNADIMHSVESRRTLFGYFEAFKGCLPPGIVEMKALTRIPSQCTEQPPSSSPSRPLTPVVTPSMRSVAGTKVHISLVDKNDQEITVGDSSDPSHLSVQLSLMDKNDQEVWSNVITVGDNSGTMAGAGSTFSTSPRPASPRVTANSETLWTTHDLQAFNIKIAAEHDIQTFFGVYDLPVPQNISPIIWNNVHAPAGPLSKTEKSFFAYMERALLTPTGESCHVVDFVRFLLRLFGYDDNPDRVLHSQKDIWFLVFGSRAYAKADVVVVQRLGSHFYYNLLVQTNTFPYDTGNCDPEAQLVAQAIAAYYHNNRVLSQIRQPVLDSHTFLGIIISCTTPTFYLITVTKALSVGVQHGICPEETTIVRKFCPPMGLADHTGDGMLSLQNRRLLFGYYEAFKQCFPLSLGS